MLTALTYSSEMLMGQIKSQSAAPWAIYKLELFLFIWVTMDNNLHAQLLHFFSNVDRKYPAHIYEVSHDKHRANAKSDFRQKARPYYLQDGVLVHQGKEVLPENRLPAVLQACHDNPSTGGHFGRDKTLAKISERFYWKGMKGDVSEYVKNCTKCFVNNPKMTTEAPPLHPIPVPAHVWSLVGIDLIGPLNESTNGNKYIVAATDHFSKWSEAAAMKDKSAHSVATFLYYVICQMGCLETLISDQGREFVNAVIDDLMERFDTNHRISSAYHPQTNGQRERDNRTLKNALAKLVNDEADDWDQYTWGSLCLSYVSPCIYKTNPIRGYVWT